MMQDDDDNDDPMILNIRAKNHTSERTIVPWAVIFNIQLSFLKFLWKSVFNPMACCKENGQMIEAGEVDFFLFRNNHFTDILSWFAGCV